MNECKPLVQGGTLPGGGDCAPEDGAAEVAPEEALAAKSLQPPGGLGGGAAQAAGGAARAGGEAEAPKPRSVSFVDLSASHGPPSVPSAPTDVPSTAPPPGRLPRLPRNSVGQCRSTVS